MNDNEIMNTLSPQSIVSKTCQCYVYPLKPHYYIVKLGFAGVYLFFLFLLQNIDCGSSLEPPRRGSSNMFLQSMFWAKIRKISSFFLLKIINFYNLRKICILHGRVFIMYRQQNIKICTRLKEVNSKLVQMAL